MTDKDRQEELIKVAHVSALDERGRVSNYIRDRMLMELDENEKLDGPLWLQIIWGMLHPVQLGKILGRAQHANETFRAIKSGKHWEGE